jgi:N utilization substance protein B
MGERRQAREIALMILYQLDVGQLHLESGLERFFDNFCGEPLEVPPRYLEGAAPEVLRLSPPVREYAERLVRGVTAHLEELDGVIQKVSTHWRIDRMARVDRNLLRLGAYEILHVAQEVPRKVVINEAVEIAKRFGAAESSAFINGILDRIGKDA